MDLAYSVTLGSNQPSAAFCADDCKGGTKLPFAM